MSEQFSAEMIAPCGMNCGICIAYFGYTMSGKKRKHTCITCRLRERPCAFIKRKCDKLKDREIEYCFKCTDFPCENLKNLDKSYKTKYGMSTIENLRYIQIYGIKEFLKNEKEKWKCSKCGGVICVHNKTCYNCK